MTAINLGIPVLSFYNKYNAKQNSLRSFMGAENIDSPISFCDEDKIKEYSYKILTDTNYRHFEGRRMKGITQTQEKFEAMLDKILKGVTQTQDKSPNVECHLEKRVENYLELQNEFQPSLLIRLNLMFGPSFIFKYPHLYSYIWQHRKEVFGIISGEIAKMILPASVYKPMKERLKNYFY